MLLNRIMRFDDPALSEAVIYFDDSDDCRDALCCPHCNEAVSVPLSPTLLKQLLHELTNMRELRQLFFEQVVHKQPTGN